MNIDEDEHVGIALSPWHFKSLPGTNSEAWPNGLEEFCERIDTLEDKSFWNEPLDTLKYGREFLDGARRFVVNQISKVESSSDEQETNNLAQGIRAFLGFALLSASSDLLIEGLGYISQIESGVPKISD